MAIKFEVVDLRNDVVAATIEIEGVSSPEEAGRRALGIDVVRSGPRRNLVAKVYWHPLAAERNMVRLYSRSSEA